MASAARRGAAALGLSMQCPSLKAFASTVTAIALPRHAPPAALRDRIKAGGTETAEALGPYGATAFRIGHLGDIRLDDVERTMAALAEALREAGPE